MPKVVVLGLGWVVWIGLRGGGDVWGNRMVRIRLGGAG